jgi:signal transduction histidine kinase
MSIKWKLFCYLLLFAIATLILLWFFQVVFLGDFYKSIKISQIKSYTNNIAENIDSEDFESVLRDIAKTSEAYIVVTDKNGKSLYSADYIPGNEATDMTPGEYGGYIKKAEANKGAYLKWIDKSYVSSLPQKESAASIHNPNNSISKPTVSNTVPAASNPKPTAEIPQQPSPQQPSPQPPDRRKIVQNVVYTLIVNQNSADPVVIIFNATITPVDATVMTIRTQFFYVAAIMLVLALLLAFFISLRISKPIIKINRSAKELARGNYDVTFDETSYKEASELGATLNYATKELAITENLRRELMANVSHDLRTPLTMITGYAEVMRDLPGENTQENIQIIIDEAKRLTSLVNDMLDISKLKSGIQKLDLTEFNLTQSTKDILKRYTKLTEQDGYSIKFIYDGEVTVFADELRISQVIYNLVNNAINYTGKDKSIVVRQSSDAGAVKIEVIDTGYGIPEEKLPLIWDRYFKAGKDHKSPVVGTGLGLSIVKAILEQHHAKYGVQSTVGKGSAFWFELKAL